MSGDIPPTKINEAPQLPGQTVPLVQIGSTAGHTYTVNGAPHLPNGIQPQGIDINAPSGPSLKEQVASPVPDKEETKKIAQKYQETLKVLMPDNPFQILEGKVSTVEQDTPAPDVQEDAITTADSTEDFLDLLNTEQVDEEQLQRPSRQSVTDMQENAMTTADSTEDFLGLLDMEQVTEEQPQDGSWKAEDKAVGAVNITGRSDVVDEIKNNPERYFSKTDSLLDSSNTKQINQGPKIQEPLGYESSSSITELLMQEHAEDTFKQKNKDHLKKLLNQAPVGSAAFNKIKSELAELERNYFQYQGIDWKAEGKTDGLICITGHPEVVADIKKNPGHYFSKEQLAILRAAQQRNQLFFPTPEQEKRIEQLAKEYGERYIKQLQQEIKKEIAEREEQLKSSSERSQAPYFRQEVDQSTPETAVIDGIETDLFRFLSKMSRKEREAFKKRLSEETRKKKEEAKEELKTREKHYWKDHEEMKKETTRIKDKKVREAQKKEHKIEPPSSSNVGQ
jgi:hypothetical protein